MLVSSPVDGLKVKLYLHEFRLQYFITGAFIPIWKQFTLQLINIMFNCLSSDQFTKDQVTVCADVCVSVE